MVEAMSHSLGNMLDPGLVMAAFHTSLKSCDNDAKRAADKVRDNTLPILAKMVDGTLPFDLSTAKGVVSTLVAWDLLVHCVLVVPIPRETSLAKPAPGPGVN